MADDGLSDDGDSWAGVSDVQPETERGIPRDR
jgi:hypothetical protein